MNARERNEKLNADKFNSELDDEITGPNLIKMIRLASKVHVVTGLSRGIDITVTVSKAQLIEKVQETIDLHGTEYTFRTPEVIFDSIWIGF